MIDLHSHSRASDGSLSPTGVIERAAEAGVRCLALTDHDTVAGLDEAASAAMARDIDLVPGIEISARWESRTVHVVGLGIDPAEPALNRAMARAAETRLDRARAMASSLARAGIDGAYRGASDIAGGEANLTRSHFARFLVAAGHAKDNRQVFKRFLVSGRPGYAPADWLGMDDAIRVIHGAGGVAVMAHPARYKVTANRLRRLLADFRRATGDAMEVCCGGGNAGEVQWLAKLAREYHLAASVGSDFHGADKPWAQLGGLPPLPDDLTPVIDRIRLR